MRRDAPDAAISDAIEAGWSPPVLPPIDVAVARSLSDLLRLVSTGRRIFVGGTDLLVAASHAGEDPGPLVWAGAVPKLQGVDEDAGRIVVGAATPLSDVISSDSIRTRAPALAEAAGVVGSVQIRNVATLVGNLCNASPAADTVPAMFVHDAVVEVTGVDGSKRTAPVWAIPAGPGRTTLGRGDIVTALSIRPLGPAEGSAYLRFTERRSMDLAFVGAGVRVALDPEGQVIRSAGIALGAVAPTVVMADEAAASVIGRPANEETFLMAGVAAAAAASPISDLRASAGYRRRLVEVLVVDAFTQACRRAIERRTPAGGEPAG